MRILIVSLVFVFSSLAQAASGTYVVPTSCPALDPYASFPISQVDVSQDENSVSITYALPVELTGIELPAITFSGTIESSKNLVLSNPNYDASILCDTPMIELTSKCDVTYGDTYKDFLASKDKDIEEAMERLIDDPQLLKIRKAIWESFSGDPIGVLHFDNLKKESQ